MKVSEMVCGFCDMGILTEPHRYLNAQIVDLESDVEHESMVMALSDRMAESIVSSGLEWCGDNHHKVVIDPPKYIPDIGTRWRVSSGRFSVWAPSLAVAVYMLVRDLDASIDEPQEEAK